MRIAAAAVVLLTACLGTLSTGAPRSGAASPLSIVVTSSADTVDAQACPDPSRCTLRKAIETANADLFASAVTITFDPAVFPPATRATITVGPLPLPVATRADLSIDGSAAGVRISGPPPGAAVIADGLVLTGPRARVEGLNIAMFAGTCLRLTGTDGFIGGDRTLGHGNAFGDCSTAIRAEGVSTRIHGNSIGFREDGLVAAPVQLGIAVSASNAVVGDDGLGAGYQNRVGNAQVGVLAGGAGEAPVIGSKVVGNTIGSRIDGAPAPVGVGVRILAPVNAAQVASNSISNAQTGVAIQGSLAGPSATGVRITGNTFAKIGRLSIDLNEDDRNNANDAGDTDVGANGLQNYPRITRAVQSRISGEACGGCQVQLYVAVHAPGGSTEFGATAVPGGVTQAGPDGSFSYESPAVTPGQWVTTLATDSQGNTSEFAPSTRVGAGSLQCGNGVLQTGWNLVGYFGAEAVSLGSSFPVEGASAGRVRAIYHLEAGTTGYTHWFADASFAGTLVTLEPGEAYWFQADAPVALAGGFSLSSPIAVQVKAGWNTLVYIGASAPIADAFASLGANYKEVYAWDAASGAWSSYSAEGAPTWAQGFTEAQPCRAFQLFSTADGTLLPLQP